MDYGVCAVSYHVTEYSVQKMKELGVKYVRIDFAWVNIEPANDSYDFSLHDTIVSMANYYGLDVIACLTYYEYSARATYRACEIAV